MRQGTPHGFTNATNRHKTFLRKLLGDGRQRHNVCDFIRFVFLSVVKMTKISSFLFLSENVKLHFNSSRLSQKQSSIFLSYYKRSEKKHRQTKASNLQDALKKVECSESNLVCFEYFCVHELSENSVVCSDSRTTYIVIPVVPIYSFRAIQQGAKEIARSADANSFQQIWFSIVFFVVSSIGA